MALAGAMRRWPRAALIRLTVSSRSVLSSQLIGLAALACGVDDASTGLDSEPVASVTVTPPVTRIAPGGRAQLHASVRDGAGTVLPEHVVTWSSTNETVATVSESGLVSGLSDGETVVTAASGGQSGSATVTVRTAVEVIEIRPAEAVISVSETLELVAITRDKDGNVLSGRQLVWTSGSAEVATVSPGGIVTGVAAGTARILATTEGEKGSALITVLAAD
jgi:uncharacterized protein YjdB